MDSPAILSPRPRPCPAVSHAVATLAGLALLVVPAFPAHAQVSVEAVATPLGGSTRYDVTIANLTPQDLALVSLVDAPLADPLIDATLLTPPGFLASYDAGLGFVDFLADFGIFGAGGTYPGFQFESLSGPGAYFTSFTAIDVLGNTFAGSIRITPGDVVVPEGGSTLAALGLFGSLAVHCARQARNRHRSTPAR